MDKQGWSCKSHTSEDQGGATQLRGSVKVAAAIGTLFPELMMILTGSLISQCTDRPQVSCLSCTSTGLFPGLAVQAPHLECSASTQVTRAGAMDPGHTAVPLCHRRKSAVAAVGAAWHVHSR